MSTELTTTVSITTPQGTLHATLGRTQVYLRAGKAGSEIRSLLAQQARVTTCALRHMTDSEALAFAESQADSNGYSSPPQGLNASGMAAAVCEAYAELVRHLGAMRTVGERSGDDE